MIRRLVVRSRIFAFGALWWLLQTHAFALPTELTFSREQRLSRFSLFLNQRKQYWAAQGAVMQPEVGPAGLYIKARLLDPRWIHRPADYAINRYDSYLQRLAAQQRAEELTDRTVQFAVARKPAGFRSPEEFDRGAGSPTHDATDAILAALQSGDVWLSPNRTYTITRPISIPSGRTVLSDGSGTILIRTGPGTSFTALDSDVGTHFDYLGSFQHAIGVADAENVMLLDFRLQCASNPLDAQPVLRGGVEVKNSSHIMVAGLELLGFPRTLGALRINSSRHVVIEDNLLHGSFTSTPTRQVTALEIDNDLYRGVFSSDVTLRGNFIFGVLLADDVYFDRQIPDRRGRALGYETDGINLVAANPNPFIVSMNSVLDTGEAIDYAGSNARIFGNHLERSFNNNLKLPHGARSNQISGNRMIGAGLASVIVFASPGEDTGANAIVENRIRFNGAFDIGSMPNSVPTSDVSAVHFLNDTTTNAATLNNISDFMYISSRLFKGAFYCSRLSIGSAAATNVLNRNSIADIPADHFYVTTDPNCQSVTPSDPIVRTTSYQQWVADGVRLELDVRDDTFGETATTDRLNADVAGAHEIRLPLNLTDWAGKELNYSVMVRRGSNSRLMVRDPVSDWHATFDLVGFGAISEQAGSNLIAAAIYPLGSNWYLLTAKFKAAATALLTLRQLSSGNGVFLDVGESRLDP